MVLTEISAGGFSRRDQAAFVGRDFARTVGLVRLTVRARVFLRRRSRSLTRRSPWRRARRVLHVCGRDDHLDRDTVDEARMTSGVGTLALASDSTLVPSGYRATG